MKNIAFVLAAASVYPAFAWNGSGKSVRFWLLGLGVFWATVGREPLVIFYGGFVATTVMVGLAARNENAPRSSFLAFAISDIALGLALTAAQSKALAWTLPLAGAWEDGALLLCLAALVRLWAGRGLVRRNVGMVSLGWWQGIYLAYLVGSSAGQAMVLGALVLWLLATLDKKASAFTVAGGAVALVAALQGAAPVALVSVGLAGSALALGRTYGLWGSLAMPLSAATQMGSLAIEPAMIVSMIALPVAWLGAARRVVGNLTWRGPVLFALVGGSAVAAAPAIGIWLVFGVAASYFVTRSFTTDITTDHVVVQPVGWDIASTIPGWVISVCAFAILARLVLIGVSTGFL
ncbi:MAG: hypothetical protein ABIS18_06830 [Actinomycetota bacterium]